jgi:hypothetical protein
MRRKYEIEGVVGKRQGFRHRQCEGRRASGAANGIDGANAVKSLHQHGQLEPIAAAQFEHP